MVDANILIAGNVWPRWPFEVLQHASRKDFNLVLSPLVIYQAKRRMISRFPTSLPQFEKYLESCEYELIKDPAKAQVEDNLRLVREVTDLPIVVAAINAKVDYLVSEDKDLTASNETTKELHKQLKVYISGTILREVMGWKSEELDVIKRRNWLDL
jgi:predicted nucleic acid-binding protein